MAFRLKRSHPSVQTASFLGARGSMADFARWQWDDIGQWRDFAEQYQAEMEAAFHNRVPSLELTIPPFGTFCMDLRMMTQVTIKGRNPGYTRDIRRQVRKIEVGYFIQGHEGDIYASDEAIDQIDDVQTLEALVRLLSSIVEDPEDFCRRSANLEEGDFASTLGVCDDAIEFLQDPPSLVRTRVAQPLCVGHVV